jgi:hypothetical protein
MYNYIITLKHDTGSIKIKTRAESMEAAIKAVTTAENCPEGAIKRIKEEKQSYIFLNGVLISFNSYWGHYQVEPLRGDEPGGYYKNLKDAKADALRY